MILIMMLIEYWEGKMVCYGLLLRMDGEWGRRFLIRDSGLGRDLFRSAFIHDYIFTTLGAVVFQVLTLVTQDSDDFVPKIKWDVNEMALLSPFRPEEVSRKECVVVENEITPTMMAMPRCRDRDFCSNENAYCYIK